MNLDQTSGNLALPDERRTEVVKEDYPLHPNQIKTKLRELLLSVNCQLNELAEINSRLSKIINSPEKRELDEDDLNFSKSLFKIAPEDVLAEPMLTYQLSWLLDFLRQTYDFEDCGVFLLGDRKGGLERLVTSSGSSEEFKDEIEALWRSGNFDGAVSQKRRIILPAKKQGDFLVVPFTILEKRDGFWVARLQQNILQEKKKSAEVLFWVELFASCIENSCLRRASLIPQKEKFHHIETEKLNTTGKLSKAVVHEINNSLQIILGRTQLLKMNERKLQKRSSNINIFETIENSANRICSILKDFSDYLHRQFDETTDAGEVNIQHILKSNLVWLEHTLRSNRIKLEVNLEGDLPAVYGDPEKLELALLSLIWEIQDHLFPGGSIRLQTSAEEGSLRLNIFCGGKRMHEDGCLEFTDLKVNDRLKLISQILGRYQGDLKFEKLSDTEIKFSLRFAITPEKKANQQVPQELRS